MPSRPDNFLWNYSMGALNGVFMHVSFAILNATTVIPVFMSELTDSSVLIALGSNMEWALWSLPQVYAASLVLHWRRKMPLYRWLTIVRVAAIGSMALAVFIVKPGPILLLSFLGAYAVYALSAGLSGVPFIDIVAKTIPIEHRGGLFAVRRFIGGSLALLVGLYLVKPVLTTYDFSNAYTILFGTAFVAVAIGLTVMSLSKEPAGASLHRKLSLRLTIAKGLKFFRSSSDFRNYYLVRIFSAVNRAALPFYILVALRNLDMDGSAAGIFLAVQMGGFVISNAIWGWLSHKMGNRILLRWGGALSLLPPLGYLLAALFGWDFAWYYYAVFAVLGMGLTGFDLGAISYLIDISPQAHRPTYIGTMNTCLAITLLVAVGGGLLGGAAGYNALFAVSLLGGFIALVMTFFLSEPRKAAKRVGTV